MALVAEGNLVARLSLDGTLDDASGNNNPVVAETKAGDSRSQSYTSDVPSPLSGALSQSASFDGGDELLTFGKLVVPTAEKTISLWIKSPDNGAADEFLLSDTRPGVGLYSYILFVNDGDELFFLNRDGNNVTEFVEVDDNQWHHIAFCYDGETQAIYVDGAVLASASGDDLPAAFRDNSTEDCIGGERSIDRFYEGMMSDFRIYNTGLDDSQIAAIYAGDLSTATYDPLTGQLVNPLGGYE